jgi:GH25 family lysozyme M1 (1,4-beta-N-acetylmuramidase)
MPTVKDFPDVSHFEPGCDFHAMAASGVTICVTKATQGTTNVDSLFHTYWPAMKAAGLKRFCYVYLMPNEAGADTQHFEDTAHLGSGDGQPIVDAEQNGLTAATVNAAMADLQARGFAPILYCSYAYWRDVLGKPTKWPLWCADYSAHMPVLPTTVNLFAWQFSDHGHCPGVPHPCDMNKWLGGVVARFLIP